MLLSNSSNQNEAKRFNVIAKDTTAAGNRFMAGLLRGELKNLIPSPSRH